MSQLATQQLDTTWTPAAKEYLDRKFRIEAELSRQGARLEKLNKLSSILEGLPGDRIGTETEKLERALTNVHGFTKAILEHMQKLHKDYEKAVMKLALTGRVTKSGYSNYLVQGWYHTRYTPTFERLFTERLAAHMQEQGVTMAHVNSQENKFLKMLEHDIDEEEGHELWALQDILKLGKRDSVDVYGDVYPETKALVAIQYDRLARKPFVGFLGYSFYLEFFIAQHSPKFVKLVTNMFNTTRSDNAFIYYHYLVDQGHSIDNIEVLNTLVTTEEDYREVIDHMNTVHMLYKGLTLRSFE